MARARPGSRTVIVAALCASLNGVACGLMADGHDWPGGGDCGDDGLDGVRHALRAVCAGNGNPDAGAPFAPGAIRKTVLLSDSQTARIAILSEGQPEWHRWSSCLPSAWAPAIVADAELVTCVGLQIREPVESCSYDLGLSKIKRFAVILPVALREAGTGVVIGGATLRHEPDPCPSPNDSDDKSDIVASAIQYPEVEQWLTPLVQRGP